MIYTKRNHSFLILLVLSLLLLTNLKLYSSNSEDDNNDKIKEIEKLNLKAQELIDDANEIYSELAGYTLQEIENSDRLEKKRRKAVKLQVEALEFQKEANALEKEVNYVVISDLKLKYSQDIPLQVKLLEEKVEELFQKASSFRKKAEGYKNEDLDEIYINLDEAQEIEKEAINKQKLLIDFYSGKTDSLLNEDIQLSDEKSENKVEINKQMLEVYLNYVNSNDSIIPSDLFRHIVYSDTFSSVNVKQVWNDYVFGDRALTGESYLSQEKESVAEDKGENEQIAQSKKQENQIITSDNSNKYFKVQVAVQNTPLSQHHLKLIYSENRKVDMVNENGWYKYSIGDFNTYKSAEEFKKSLKTEGAFVVAYEDGVKSDISGSIEKKSNESVVEENVTFAEDLIYKVQIAASKVKLSDKEIGSIYNGTKQVDVTRENGWYKYSIGKLEEYNQAMQLTKSVDVAGAFIVAYRGDEKVPLRKTKNNLTSGQDIHENSDIVFKVQVAADTKPLTSEKLHRIYSGHENIEKYQEDGWYKYAIGTFNSFEEANELRKNSGVRGAFVIAFRNGEKLNVLEAKKAVRCFDPIIHTSWINNNKELVFRVQIAASLVELSEKQLKEICCVMPDVYMIHQNGWYKYSIGNNKTYEESLELRKVINIEGAFTVAFKNGEPLNIKEAINLSKK